MYLIYFINRIHFHIYKQLQASKENKNYETIEIHDRKLYSSTKHIDKF